MTSQEPDPAEMLATSVEAALAAKAEAKRIVATATQTRDECIYDSYHIEGLPLHIIVEITGLSKQRIYQILELVDHRREITRLKAEREYLEAFHKAKDLAKPL